MGDTLEALSHAGEAAVNLVISSVGIPAANVLREKFGTPFLVGTPVEDYEGEISDALERIADSSRGEWVNKKDNSAEESGGQILGKQEELWKVTPEQVIYFQGRNSLSAVSAPSGESRELSDGDELFFFRTGHYHHRRTGYHGLPGSSHRAEIRKKSSDALSAGDHGGTFAQGR